ncbi:Tricarboxylate/iron carrier [Globomyces pollinis-pini]|nr:Tricarboxylate/iron carrier [Globomyces pollinis-pini]
MEEKNSLNGGIIDITKPRYDQSTYWGRLKHFSQLTNPLNLLASNAQLQEAKSLVDNYIAGKSGPVEKERLWQAKTLVDSTFHPDTGDKVFLPFRMASFVPTNVPIIASMLIPNPTMAMVVASQWVNQSANVAFNYANANKTTPMSTQETLMAYGAAVVSSCSIALGLNHWVSHRAPVQFRPFLGRTVPFVAVALAGTLNVYLMRRKELVDGIIVQDKDGNNLGRSPNAGANAISQVAISRIATAAPALFLPGLIMSQLEKTTFLKRNPRLNLPLNLVTVSASLLVALPCAIALFPQVASLEVNKLEPQFQNLKDKKGNPIDKVFFNRGL